MKTQREGGMLIAKIHQLGGRIFTRLLKKNKIQEINHAQGRIMFALWRNDGIAIHELAEKTSLSKSTLTSMLDRLEKAGFLIRVPSSEDRRKIVIERTAKDRALQDTYVQVSEEMNLLFYRGFTEAEKDEFEAYLRRIFRNLSEPRPRDP